MTLTLNKTHSSEVKSKTTVQDHRLKAAEHPDNASKRHKETSKLIEAGDHPAASSHAKLAEELIAHAAHQAKQAGKETSTQAATSK